MYNIDTFPKTDRKMAQLPKPQICLYKQRGLFQQFNTIQIHLIFTTKIENNNIVSILHTKTIIIETFFLFVTTTKVIKSIAEGNNPYTQKKK